MEKKSGQATMSGRERKLQEMLEATEGKGAGKGSRENETGRLTAKPRPATYEIRQPPKQHNRAEGHRVLFMSDKERKDGNDTYRAGGREQEAEAMAMRARVDEAVTVETYERAVCCVKVASEGGIDEQA